MFFRDFDQAICLFDDQGADPINEHDGQSDKGEDDDRGVNRLLEFSGEFFREILGAFEMCRPFVANKAVSYADDDKENDGQKNHSHENQGVVFSAGGPENGDRPFEIEGEDACEDQPIVDPRGGWFFVSHGVIPFCAKLIFDQPNQIAELANDFFKQEMEQHDRESDKREQDEADEDWFFVFVGDSSGCVLHMFDEAFPFRTDGAVHEGGDHENKA